MTFLGGQTKDAVAEALQQADLFLLPSVAEAMPVVLMEAQATGLPVVATDVGSVRDLVRDEVSGYVVPSRSPEDLAGRLIELLDHPASWPIMGREGRNHIELNHNHALLMDGLVTLYEIR